MLRLVTSLPLLGCHGRRCTRAWQVRAKRAAVGRAAVAFSSSARPRPLPAFCSTVSCCVRCVPASQQCLLERASGAGWARVRACGTRSDSDTARRAVFSRIVLLPQATNASTPVYPVEALVAMSDSVQADELDDRCRGPISPPPTAHNGRTIMRSTNLCACLRGRVPPLPPPCRPFPRCRWLPYTAGTPPVPSSCATMDPAISLQCAGCPMTRAACSRRW